MTDAFFESDEWRQAHAGARSRRGGSASSPTSPAPRSSWRSRCVELHHRPVPAVDGGYLASHLRRLNAAERLPPASREKCQWQTYRSTSWPTSTRLAAPRCSSGPSPTSSGFVENVRPIIDAVRTEGDARCRASHASSTRPTSPPGGLKATRGGVRRGLQGASSRQVVEAIQFARRQHPRLPRGAEAGADVAEGDPAGRLRRRPLHADHVGRALRAARQGRVPLGDDDDLGAGGRRRRARNRDRHAADAGWLGRRRRRWSPPGSPASRRSTNAAARRRSRRSPTAPRPCARR